MNRETWNLDYGPLRGLYRDRENGWVFGVCAGIAEYFNFRTGTVRVLAVISLVLFFWITVLVYLGATLLFREKPLIYSGSCMEREFWRRTLEKLEQKEGDLQQAIDLMTRRGALHDTIERARHYGAIARDALGIFPDGPVKDAMAEAIDFAIERAY